LLAGFFFGSVAVLADGVDSLFDILTSASVLVGTKASEKPPDAGHPYGHGRFENVPSLVVAGSLFAAALGILYEALRKIARAEYGAFEWIALGAALFSVVGKYLLQRYLFGICRKVGSLTLMSYAKNIRGDVLTSVSVSVGVAAAALGMPWADPLVAIMVAALILKTGAEIAADTVRILADASPGAETASRIRSIALAVPGVKDCHRVRARRSGRLILVDMHILVDPGMEVETSHKISDEVVEAIMKNFAEVGHVLVHVEPSSLEEDAEDHSKVIAAIESEAMKVKQVAGCHGVRLQHLGEGMVAEVHILVNPALSITETHRISEEVSARVRSLFPNVKRVVVHEEPKGVGDAET
ncbi:MAG: cation-efflux pump, partial [Candidatus Brockarchaeota archaeon]|nr:cation-efflux pump [Candidatus Brockarchaeota archaeon]